MAAIIEDDHDSIMQLLEEMPPLTKEEALQANNMIKETIKLFQQEKKNCLLSMDKIKKNIAFLSHDKEKSRLYTLS